MKYFKSISLANKDIINKIITYIETAVKWWGVGGVRWMAWMKNRLMFFKKELSSSAVLLRYRPLDYFE